MEFIPRQQLPTGLAEQLLRMKSQEPDPTSALYNTIGKLAGDVSQSYIAMKQRQGAEKIRQEGIARETLTPEKAKYMGLDSNVPSGMPVSYGEKMAGLKQQGAEKEKLGMISVTQEMIDKNEAAKKAGVIPGDYPKSFAEKMFTAQKPPSASVGLRDEQFYKKQWVDTAKEMDLSKASSRTPLGQAVTNNMKSMRGMKLLDTKGKFTPEDKSLVVTDLAAMMKQGAPDIELIRSQNYGSLYENFKELQQKITANPQNLDIPEIRQHLKEVINGIIEVDNNIIKGHVDNIESGRSDVIAKRPEDWKKLKEKTLSSIHTGGSGPKVGEVIDGHTFLGGDPANPASWKK